MVSNQKKNTVRRGVTCTKRDAWFYSVEERALISDITGLHV
jgi:hypothetical protein